MAYCEDKAVPHSVFLGREVSLGEPYWLDEDRAKVLAYRLEKAQKCHRCGTASWEWAADPHAYEPMIEACIGCIKLEAVRKDIPAGDSTKHAYLSPKRVAEMIRRRPKRMPRRRR
jgi:hypothetical protein